MQKEPGEKEDTEELGAGEDSKGEAKESDKLVEMKHKEIELELASRGSTAQGDERRGSRWVPGRQEDPCLGQLHAGNLRRGQVQQRRLTPGEVTCKFSIVYSRLTVPKRC